MKKVLLVITLLLALLLISAATFAGEKTTPTGNKPASVSTKKAEEECDFREIEDAVVSGELSGLPNKCLFEFNTICSKPIPTKECALESKRKIKDSKYIKNECFIDFVLKKQTENLSSNKPLGKKIAYQQKLHKLLNGRDVPYRMIEDPFGSELWRFYFHSAPTLPPDWRTKWSGSAWIWCPP